MKCTILHESPNRMRIHVEEEPMSLSQADIWEFYLKSVEGIMDAKVHDRTGNIIITYICNREKIIKCLSEFSYEKALSLVPEHTGRQLNREYENKLAFTVLKRVIGKAFLPYPLKTAFAIFYGTKYISKALKALSKRNVNVDVLDGTAIGISLVRGNFSTAASIMFMLKVGEILEEWTHKKTVDDLARSMALNVDNTWLIQDGKEILTSINEIKVGDKILVRTGNVIPLDGKVLVGEAMVNQASITGESIPVHKAEGSYVYAGTVVEEGCITISVDKDLGSGRYDRIVKMIEESEKLKSNTESKAGKLADKLVPYTLGATVITYLLTKNVTKALSILMVDFSCALKLSMPIAVLSAMRESNFYNISVKGGKFMEAVSEADTIVFDKTGTLTHAVPKVAGIVTFGGKDETEMLRLAACLEEHYPHSIANAVVEEAKSRGLIHEENHSTVEYVVAHGISSKVGDEKVIIGSHHFVFQDEGAVIPEGEEVKFDNIPPEYSQLFLAISGKLASVILIEDPLREEAMAVINSLKKLGIKKTIMMTGDNDRTAKVIAEAVGVDEYYAEVLPEDKANFIKAEREAGRKVIMIGDGINDSPALSEADVGIAISEGAAIAREIADITISADNLFALVTLKSVSDALMARIKKNYRFIISFNFMLILLGVGGVIPPTTSAFLHNLSTLGVSVKSMTNLLE